MDCSLLQLAFLPPEKLGERPATEHAIVPLILLTVFTHFSEL